MSILFLFWEVDESAKMYYHERKPLSMKTLVTCHTPTNHHADWSGGCT